MESFLKEHLEDYLSGRLRGEALAEFERRLEQNPASVDEIALFQETSELFTAFAVDAEEDVEPAPGFYYRVMERVEQERADSFWSFLLRPVVVRRFAFAAMMWLLVLGSVAVFHDDTTQQTVQLADSILRQETPDQYQVRMGYDIEENRDSMLSVLVASAE